ncbi:MAG: hypothetical protein RL754_157 [Bacteroidota bacterium]|jgi:hypothetical protein
MDSKNISVITKKEIGKVLAEGCDERVHLVSDTNRNKYHLNPMVFEDLFQRGSCTANVCTPRSSMVAKAFLGKYEELNYESLLETQSNRLRHLVQDENKDPFDVFFAPSGSDLVYYPIMFQMMLNPDKKVLNIVSCPEELGSGSKYASETRYYANYNQFGERIEKGALIDLNNQSEVHYLDARDADGNILDRTQAIKDIIAQNPDKAAIGSLVFGSKSGIKDDLDVIDPNSETMWVVDLCQFRVDRGLIHDLLQKGVMVMLTGSKFFQAPPFCAAMLVPRKWTDKLRKAESVDAIKPYGSLFSKYDMPWFMENMRSQLPAKENKALRLRWEMALDEMEAYSYWSQSQTDDIITRWAMAVMGRLETSTYFKLMPDQLKTNMSIISFQVWVGGKALNNDQLQELFKQIATAEHEGFIGGMKRVFFGQPVQYGDKSFIRLALGSYGVRQFLDADGVDLHNDYRLIEILEEYAERLFGAQ